jgi:hypothetical protein
MVPFQGRISKVELQMYFAYAKNLRIQNSLPLLFVFMIVFFTFSPRAVASKQDERIYTAPDSHIAGLLNTEVAPQGAYQLDVTTGHAWYGIGEATNLVTNVFVDSMALIGTPAVSFGGKHRYCETTSWSCSIFLEAAWGMDLVGERRRLLGGLAQQSFGLDLEDSGRFIFGWGGSVYGSRNVEKKSREYTDEFNSWLNLAYDFSFFKDWSVGLGLSSSLRGLSQTNKGNELRVRRLGFAAGKLFHARTQYSFTDWQFTAGGALLSVGSNWSLWPLFEIHYLSLPRI